MRSHFVERIRPNQYRLLKFPSAAHEGTHATETKDEQTISVFKWSDLSFGKDGLKIGGQPWRSGFEADRESMHGSASEDEGQNRVFVRVKYIWFPPATSKEREIPPVPADGTMLS
jgi:hypothetical protein